MDGASNNADKTNPSLLFIGVHLRLSAVSKIIFFNLPFA
jgi:hypothetical protein